MGTHGLGAFISGVILYEETHGQRSDDGTPLPELVARQGIVPGIKVDAGKITLAHAHAPGDEITQGLDGLAKRPGDYKEQAARLAKWRAVYNVSRWVCQDDGMQAADSIPLARVLVETLARSIHVRLIETHISWVLPGRI